MGKAKHKEEVVAESKQKVPALVFENGRYIEGVTKAMWDFEVSGYKVLPRWFAARTHWVITNANSLHALRTVIAVGELVDLQPTLDQALAALLS